MTSAVYADCIASTYRSCWYTLYELEWSFELYSCDEIHMIFSDLHNTLCHLLSMEFKQMTSLCHQELFVQVWRLKIMFIFFLVRLGKNCLQIDNLRYIKIC